MKDSRFSIRPNCRACGSTKLDRVLALEPLPLVSPNVGVTAAEASSALGVTVPLDLHLCDDCGLLQLNAVIDPAFHYNKFKYVTTISRGLPEHFKRSAGEILTVAALPEQGNVLEIGSNDGTLLRAFQEQGWRALGIDPAEHAAKVASGRGIETIVGFFNPCRARDIARRMGTAKLVIANNTLANIDDLDGVAAGLDAVLEADGVFVFETSYGADVVHKFLLDTVYHEHLSYFMVRPLQTYFARHGFELFHVEKIDTKGGSIRGFVQRAGGSRSVRPDVGALIEEEQADGLFTPALYRKMAARLGDVKSRIGAALAEARGRDGIVAGYGASVGCITLINQFGLGSALSCVFDDHPLLDMIAGPGYNISVRRADLMMHEKPSLVVILAWRYAEMIMRKNESFHAQGGRFLMLFPDVRVQ